MANIQLVDSTIDEWLAEHAVVAMGQSGTPYFKLDNKTKLEKYQILIDSLDKLGFPKEELKSNSILERLVFKTVAPIDAFKNKSKRRGVIAAIKQTWNMAITLKYAKTVSEERYDPSDVLASKEPEERELVLPNNGDFDVIDEDLLKEYPTHLDNEEEIEKTIYNPIKRRTLEEQLAEELEEVEPDDWI